MMGPIISFGTLHAFDGGTYNIIDQNPKIGQYEWYAVYVTFWIRIGLKKDSFKSMNDTVICRRMTKEYGEVLNFDDEVNEALDNLTTLYYTKGIIPFFLRKFNKPISKFADKHGIDTAVAKVSICKLVNPNYIYNTEIDEGLKEDGYENANWYDGNEKLKSLPFKDRKQVIFDHMGIVAYDFDKDNKFMGIRKFNSNVVPIFACGWCNPYEEYHRKYNPGDIIEYPKTNEKPLRYYEFVSICPDSISHSSVMFSNTYSRTEIDGYDTCEDYDLEDARLVQRASKGTKLFGTKVSFSKHIGTKKNYIPFEMQIQDMDIINAGGDITDEMVKNQKINIMKRAKWNLFYNHKILSKILGAIGLSTVILNRLLKSQKASLIYESVEYCNADLWKPNEYSKVLQRYGYDHEFDCHKDGKSADDFIRSLDHDTRIKLLDEARVSRHIAYDENLNIIDITDSYYQFIEKKPSDYNL